MLTPSRYWRVPCDLELETAEPASEFVLPDALANQATPPARGHGLVVAAYDPGQQTGLFRWVGIIVGGSGATRKVEWRASEAQIWVDTPSGRTFWQRGPFGFAAKKVPDYGLHELWRDHFDGIDLRSRAPMVTIPKGPRMPRRGNIASERLDPLEVIGEPTEGRRSGVVYVLKSAYGYKVGRTNNVPARMRAFGVHLPFAYTIPLCVWFDDNHVAERRYHDLFANKRINGEWFDLGDSDIEQIRLNVELTAVRRAPTTNQTGGWSAARWRSAPATAIPVEN